MRCWIDTDVGDNPDDAVALWCAVQHPGVELVGVSTVDGDVERRARIARELLTRAGSAETPVVAGPPPPGLGGAEALLAIGPWTHVASARWLPPRVALMGGTLEPVVHRGRTVTVDHNVARDRDAAARVLGGARRMLVVPLDATVNVVCTDGERAAIAAAVPAVDDWPEPLVLHDPVTLLALTGDVPLEFEDREVGGGRHDVVVRVDAAAARARVVELCAQRRGPQPAPSSG